METAIVILLINKNNFWDPFLIFTVIYSNFVEFFAAWGIILEKVIWDQ